MAANGWSVLPLKNFRNSLIVIYRLAERVFCHLVSVSVSQKDYKAHAIHHIFLCMLLERIILCVLNLLACKMTDGAVVIRPLPIIISNGHQIWADTRVPIILYLVSAYYSTYSIWSSVFGEKNAPIHYGARPLLTSRYSSSLLLAIYCRRWSFTTSGRNVPTGLMFYYSRL